MKFKLDKVDVWVRGILVGLAIMLIFYAGNVLSGRKQLKCSKAKKVQIMMVYPSYKQVCEEQPKARRLTAEKEDDDGCDDDDDRKCVTVYTEDCVTVYDTVQRQDCRDDGGDGDGETLNGRRLRGHLGITRRIGSLIPRPGFLLRSGLPPPPFMSSLSKIKQMLTPPPSPPVPAPVVRPRREGEFKIVHREGEQFKKSSRSSKKCRTVTETRVEKRRARRCSKGRQTRCRTVQKQECRTVSTTVHDRVCRTYDQERCFFDYASRREEVEEEECRTEYREVCSEPVIDFYVFFEGKCESVPEEKCAMVPKQREVLEPQKTCHQVPAEECRSVPKQVPKQECWQVPVKECGEFPVEVCRDEEVRVPKKVTKTVCHEEEDKEEDDKRPKREEEQQQQQVHLQEGRREQQGSQGCRLEYKQVPRLKCTRVPRTKCEKKRGGGKCLGRRRPSRQRRDDDDHATATAKKKNCRRVGVGRPKRVPRVSPTVVCTVEKSDQRVTEREG